MLRASSRPSCCPSRESYPDKAKGTFNRVAYSAAHVVADAMAANDPWIDCALDWEKTLRYREYLWDLGLGVAEAMDTAQRGMGLDWPTSLELIRRAVAAGKAWEARERPPGADRLWLRHRSSRSQQRALRRRGDPRLRGADGGHREGGRAPDRHGQPRARPRRQVSRRLRARLRSRARPGARAGDHPLAGRDVRSRARRLLGQRRPHQRQWTPPSASSMRTPPRSTASRSPCSTRTKRSSCAAGWRRACACIRATTSTTPS